MSLATEPLDVLQACLESVALRFKQIYGLLTKPFAIPAQVVASGGALLRSRVWLQMMTNALAHPTVECLVPEASSRGAAIIAAEQMGLIPDLDCVPVQLGDTVAAQEEHAAIFETMLGRDGRLFDALYGPYSRFDPPEHATRIGNTTAPIGTA